MLFSSDAVSYWEFWLIEQFLNDYSTKHELIWLKKRFKGCIQWSMQIDHLALTKMKHNVAYFFPPFSYLSHIIFSVSLFAIRLKWKTWKDSFRENDDSKRKQKASNSVIFNTEKRRNCSVSIKLYFVEKYSIYVFPLLTANELAHGFVINP